MYAVVDGDKIDCTKSSKIMKVVDGVNLRDGQGLLKFATLGARENWMMRSEMRSPQYTTRWKDLLTVK